MFKNFEEDLKEMQLNMYKYILEGKQRCFPSGYWSREGSASHFKMFLLYYVHDVLNYPKDRVPYEIISKKLLTEAKLLTPYRELFGGRLEIMFKEVFPEIYPYEMPIISDELWLGTGIWEGEQPLKDIFPKWYIEEHLGLNEDNVVGLIGVAGAQKDFFKYKNIIRGKYRSLSDCIHRCYPNKDLEKIKSGIKGRTTSRVALLKRKTKDPSIDLREKIIIYKSDDNCYYTNTGCNIHVYSENGLSKLRILNPDRKPTYREIHYILNKLTGETEKTYYLNIDQYSNDIVLTEGSSPLGLNVYISTSFDKEVKPHTAGLEYSVSIIENNMSKTHLVTSTCKENTELDELKALRNSLFPGETVFIVLFSPEMI